MATTSDPAPRRFGRRPSTTRDEIASIALELSRSGVPSSLPLPRHGPTSNPRILLPQVVSFATLVVTCAAFLEWVRCPTSDLPPELDDVLALLGDGFDIGAVRVAS